MGLRRASIGISWILITFLIVGAVNQSIAQDIIPLPKKLVKNGSTFTLNKDTKIYYEKGLKIHATLLLDMLFPATGWTLEAVESGKDQSNSILLSIDKSLPSEGYQLHVDEKAVKIHGGDEAGVFYGFQTLLQLLPPEIYNKELQRSTSWVIEGVDIQDEPEYAWRGMMLDVSRYFFDKDYVMKYIDMMSMYKLNTLHLHLIDDAGWRLEIEKYPRLTSIGAWRGEGAKRTGGYYTQDDIREIVAYAELRNVQVIPEIEVPAHNLAAVAAYPYLSCNGTPVQVPEQHFISRDLYCVGKESTFDFLEDVFEETFKLFPSKYIHIGGDEARYDRWKECPYCQKRKAELGLETEAELQVYFNRRIQKMVKKYGKTIVGWDEIIEEGLEEKAVGMVWHNKKKALEATENGHDIVLALTDYLYFDFPESGIPGEVKAATWMPPISLEKVYQFDPVIEGLDEKYRPQVLGAQGALWSDQFIHGTILQEIEPINENRSEAYFDYLTFPRLSALAETVWTPKSMKNWDGFQQRMQSHYQRLDQAGIGYRVPQPKLLRKEVKNGQYSIELECPVDGAEIRFTTDGIKPNVHSEIYSKPIMISRLQDFQAITVVSRHHYSLPLYFPVTYPQYEKYGVMIGEWRTKDVYADQEVVLEWNATGKIKKNGIYEVNFIATDGDNSMEIRGIKILKNGKEVAADSHRGSSKTSLEENVFAFSIDDYETGAAFTIQANAVGVGGTDTNGVIVIKLKDE